MGRGSRGCYWSRWRRCRNWAVRAIRQGVRAAWDARHDLSAAIGLDKITSKNSHIHKTAKHIAKETQKALKNADKLITMIKYGINNIRDLFGPKVKLGIISSNPIARYGIDE